MESATFQTVSNVAPFDALAESYDEAFTHSLIGRAQREIVTQELDRVFHSGQRILECNCGTGIDAIHLASRGVEVLACDISPRIIEMARRNADRIGRQPGLRTSPLFRVLAIEKIGSLREEGMAGEFDGAFSNFAGLNCVENLRKTACELAALLRPGAPLVLCVFGRFCAWEILWYLGRRKPAKAFRRFSRGGNVAHLAEGVTVRVHYPSVRELARVFAPMFELERWRGVGLAVPPTYVEPTVGRFPNLLEILAKLDHKIGALPVARCMADHTLLTFVRGKN